MAFNPFLMESDYSQPQATAAPIYMADVSAASSNPFLSFGAPAPEPQPATMVAASYDAALPGQGYGAATGGDNPFLSYGGYNDTSAVAAAASSNPFADFGAPAPQATAYGVGANAYFASTADMSYHHVPVDYYQQQQQPQEMQLIDTSEPPHPNTQNLLESVTGVLEATSDSLLDRLRTNAPSPTPDLIPSPRSPSPDLMGGEISEIPTIERDPSSRSSNSDTAVPPPPPPSANPLSPSPIPDTVLDIFNTIEPKIAAVSAPTSSTIDLMGLYMNPPAAVAITSAALPTEPKAVAAIVEVPVTVPVAAASFPLVDLIIEPATPLVKEHPKEQEEEEKQIKVEEAMPMGTLSPEVTTPISSPPEGKPPPPRPPSPSKISSPTHVEEMPPARPPPARPAPPPAVVQHEPPKPPPSRPPPPPVIARTSPLSSPAPQPAAPIYPVQPPTAVHAFGPATTETSNHFVPASAPPPPPPVVNSTPFATSNMGASIFGSTSKPQPKRMDTFDAFDAKFESASGSGPSSGAFGEPPAIKTTASAWGDGNSVPEEEDSNELGFGSNSTFDQFLAMTEPPPVPQSTPAKIRKDGSGEEDYEDKEISISIRPRNEMDLNLSTLAPALAPPPPKSPAISSTGSAYSYSEEGGGGSSYVPFLSQSTVPTIEHTYADLRKKTTERSDSAETPTTPLYEEDTSQPLEDFPRVKVQPEGWEMQVRYPNKKVTFGGQRSWKAVWVRIEPQGDIPVLKIYGKKGDANPIQEIPLQSSYSVSEISAQQFDQYGKIFTIKIQFVYYKERPGVRPGQIGKASKLSSKLSAFAAYAITGDPSGVKEFGSDLKKLGLPLEHAPQASQLVKLGTTSFDDMKQFSVCIEEALFRLPTARDRSLNYKTEEIQCTIVDEYFVEQDALGVVTRQIARVRVMFLSFLNGLADIEMGVNDLRRQGKEIVGRHDICPVPTEEWIRMEDIEFSNIVNLDEFGETQLIKFKPPDASYLELMRFRVRPPRHRELPLQVKTTFITTGQRIEIRSDILVPGYTSRKLGQIPCEDVMIRFPIPESWIYMFRVEKHFRYGSVKSAHRRSGKVKGIERVLGALDVVEPSLMETTSGQAKYEHHHRAIVWRIPRLPKEGQGAYTTHSFFCHITLQPHEKIPDNLTRHCYVEFTMPHTTVSHTVCRSISVPTSDEPPEKCCKYLSRHEYIVEIEHREGMTPATYSAAAEVKKEEEVKPVRGEFEETKYDSDFSDE